VPASVFIFWCLRLLARRIVFAKVAEQQRASGEELQIIVNTVVFAILGSKVLSIHLCVCRPGLQLYVNMGVSAYQGSTPLQLQSFFNTRTPNHCKYLFSSIPGLQIIVHTIGFASQHPKSLYIP